jgi:tRNA (guanine37-N1)-methyltransferase
MRFEILTLHPGLCQGPLEGSIIGRAREKGLVDVRIHDLRNWAEGRHKQADDLPFGGGRGMVMKVDVVDRALQALRTPSSHVILMEASGTRFDQATARRLANSGRDLVLLCGHYEGVDARVREHLVDECLSIGDFVLTGGELPALVVVDAVARLLPGVLGNAGSLDDESFNAGLLEYPQYTRPALYRSWAVPEILLSGHHARVESWRREQSLARTRQLRPELLDSKASEEKPPAEPSEQPPARKDA